MEVGHQIFQVPEGAYTPVGSNPHSLIMDCKLEPRKGQQLVQGHVASKRQLWDLYVACLGSRLLQIQFLHRPVLSVLSLHYQVVLDENPKFLQT